MKKLLLVLSIVAGLLSSVYANDTKPMKNFRAVDPSKAEMLQKGEGKNFCPVCGMTLPMFYKTNHAAKVDGVDKQYCSIHCMIEDKEVNGNNLTDFKAVDNETMKFKNSKDMYFVVGSKQPGTMSPISKYGFGTKEGAKKFAAKFGGEIMTFNELYSFVKKGLQKDISATKKRQAKAAAMGEKIYAKMCKQTEERFDKPSDAKTYLQQTKLCGNIKGKKLQAVALYLSGKGKAAPAMKCGAGKCGGMSKCGK